MKDKDQQARQRIYDSILMLEKILCPYRQKLLQDLDLTSSQAQALYSLEDNSTVKNLADSLYISSSATTQLVEILESKDMLVRHRSNADRRVVNIELTKHGESVKKKLIKTREEATDDLLKGLDSKELAELARMHDKMVKRLQEKYSNG